MTDPMSGAEGPERIWLEPLCDDADPEERCWCTDPLEDCQECDSPAVPYVRQDTHDALLRERDDLRARLDAAERALGEARDGALREALFALPETHHGPEWSDYQSGYLNGVANYAKAIADLRATPPTPTGPEPRGDGAGGEQ